MGIIKSLNSTLYKTTGYRFMKAAYDYGAVWANSSVFGMAGLGGENNDLIRTDEGAALAQTVSVAAYRAIEARRYAVGSMPWRISDMDTGRVITTSKDARSKHLLGIALHQANGRLGQSLFSAWELSMTITGKAFIEPYKNDYGFYTGLDWLNPTRVRIDTLNGTIQGFWYTGESQHIGYAPDEIVYERFPNLVSDVYGLSPLFVAMQRINISVNTDRFLSSFFRNNGRFGQVISSQNTEVPLNELEIQKIKTQVEGAKGSDRAFRTLVMPVPINVHYPDEVDLSKNVDVMERIETSIYTALGVPRPVAGDVDGQRYQASPEALEWFYQNVIIPRCRDIEKLVNSDLLPRFDRNRNSQFQFDTTEWDRISPTRMMQLEIAERGFNDGVMTLNERRRLTNEYITGLDLDPLDNGDVLLVGGSYVPKDAIGALPQLPTITQPAQTPSNGNDRPSLTGAVSDDIEDAQVSELASQADALAELRTWRKYAKKHGAVKARSFDTLHLEGWQALRIQHGLADGNEQEAFEALEAVIKYHDPEPHKLTPERLAVSIAAQKAIQSTRSDFENNVEDLLFEAVQGNIDRRRFGNRLRGLVQVAVSKAYLDGLEDGGISEPELTADDSEWIADFFNEQRDYIINITDAIYKDGRVTADEIENKAQMWFNKSVGPAYYEGVASAGRNGAFEWVLGNREEHCRSCVRLNGQVRRMSFWRGNIMPQSSELECNGFNCGCSLVPTRRGITRGKLPSWRAVHNHG